MHELFGHRVELPSSPCVAGNRSGVKLRRRDGARASEGTASRPRDAAGSDPARIAVGPSIHLPARASASACLTTCRATLQLSQLTKPAHPRVPQSDRRMQRLRGGAAAVIRQESSPRRQQPLAIGGGPGYERYGDPASASDRATPDLLP
jgi:hypothetical protein